MFKELNSINKSTNLITCVDHSRDLQTDNGIEFVNRILEHIFN